MMLAEKREEMLWQRPVAIPETIRHWGDDERAREQAGKMDSRAAQKNGRWMAEAIASLSTVPPDP